MNDLVRALAISAGILLPIVILIIVVSIATVRRGEISMGLVGHHGHDELAHAHGTAAPAATAAAKAPAKGAAGPAVDEISVPMILIGGVILFTVTVLLLFGLSLIQHM